MAGARSSAQAWRAISDMVGSQTRARTLNVRLALQTTSKGTMSISEYFGKMKAYSDEIASTGKPLDEEDTIAYIVNGLDGDYDSFVSALGMRVEPITMTELYAQLLNFENRLHLRKQGSANAAHRGNGGRGNFIPRGGAIGAAGGTNPGRGHGDSGRGRGSTGGNRGGWGGNQQRVDTRPVCQVYYKRGHVVAECWHRFDANYVPGERHVAAAAYAYGLDTNWYIDTGATDHLTSELDKLTTREKYKGTDQIHTANGAGMKIEHIGHSLIYTPDRTLHLKNVLHVPQASKNLISASRLAEDNYAFLEIHSKYFLVKDLATKKIILRGRRHRGLYPLPSSTSKQSYSVIPSFTRCHSRLGHPSTSIVARIISKNKLPCLSESRDESVCDPCQKAKSHQLPYSKSSSFSSNPLDLIYSDVWGPAPDSVGGKKYYMSFIDDYSKFTWVYPIKYKSDVFQRFHEFQVLVERLLGHKIIAMQTDWGGEYEKLHSFFEKIRITHHVSCPHAHQQNGSAERKHRHIVEVGLALLAQASMPLKFWDEAFLTASYLINRTPSKVIQFETPLEKLFHRKPNYQFLQVFGCACWPNLRPYNNHKLQFCSKQCAFLRYSHLHKGFKCLDISTGRVYIFRDVIFDENVFPFSQLHSNAGARLRAEISLLPSSLVPHCTDQGGEHGIDHMLNTAPNEPSDDFSGENVAEDDADSSAGTQEDVHGEILMKNPLQGRGPCRHSRQGNLGSRFSSSSTGDGGHNRGCRSCAAVCQWSQRRN